MTLARLARGAAIATLALGTMTSTATAQRGGGPPGGARGERLEALLKRRVGLSDDQLTRLRTTTRTFAPQRMALARQERGIADSLAAQVARARRDETLVSGLLTRLFAVRRARLELREREQQAQAAFMTPSQRALLLGFQEQAQRRAASLRAQRTGGGH